MELSLLINDGFDDPQPSFLSQQDLSICMFLRARSARKNIQDFR